MPARRPSGPASPAITELDQIVLTSHIARHALRKGDVGTVVHVYRGGEAFEVEFMTLGGDTIAVETVTRDQVRPVLSNDVHHARPRTSQQAPKRSRIGAAKRLSR